MNMVINLNKPKGITSQEAVNKVKKIFKVKKAGHAGTLDPLATGVLLICLNEATKITPFLSDLEKEYIVTMKLGEKTDTYDSEGKILERFDIGILELKDIENILKRFVGEIEQVPPMYSAIKYKGKPLYKWARRGIEVPREPRKVLIRYIDLLEFSPPFLKLKIACSKGTYIRSFCNDIGVALGVGAHMFELLRTKVGNFSIEDSITLEDLIIKKEGFFSIDDALSFLPEIFLNEGQEKRARHGNPIDIDVENTKLAQKTFIRLKNSENTILGIGKITKNFIKIERLFNI